MIASHFLGHSQSSVSGCGGGGVKKSWQQSEKENILKQFVKRDTHSFCERWRQCYMRNLRQFAGRLLPPPSLSSPLPGKAEL